MNDRIIPPYARCPACEQMAPCSMPHHSCVHQLLLARTYSFLRANSARISRVMHYHSDPHHAHLDGPIDFDRALHALQLNVDLVFPLRTDQDVCLQIALDDEQFWFYLDDQIVD